MTTREQIRVEDLFPGARGLFPAPRRRPIVLVALALAGAILLLLGVRLLRWADHNL